MKPKRTRARKPAAIANPRWLSYATAGVASAFACGHPDSAEGTIHYSGPINRTINRWERVTFQLDRAGDFIWLSDRTGTAYAGYERFGVSGLAGASIVGGKPPFYDLAANLKRGQLVSTERFIPGTSTGLSAQYTGFTGSGYIGFKFNNGTGDQYGWVRIQTRPSFGAKFFLRDYAYGDVGDRIKTGQRSDDQAAPNEGSLGWLAMGAAGLLAWRKRRSGAAGRAPTQA